VPYLPRDQSRNRLVTIEKQRGKEHKKHKRHKSLVISLVPLVLFVFLPLCVYLWYQTIVPVWTTPFFGTITIPSRM
jgi:hypothetical protein